LGKNKKTEYQKLRLLTQVGQEFSDQTYVLSEERRGKISEELIKLQDIQIGKMREMLNTMDKLADKFNDLTIGVTIGR